MAIEILYEDNDVLALAKASGQLVIPGRGEMPGLPLIQELESHFKKKLFVVHRLDRGASGLVLFAKHPNAHRHLCMQFEKREVKKTYLVLVQGRVPQSGTIEQPLKVFGSGRMGVDPAGKPSRTLFRIVDALPQATLLEVSPETGRRHQIRVHLYSIGHPVMGDTLYGKDRPVGGIARLMLHAWKIQLAHPNGQSFALEAAIPADFTTVVEETRRVSAAKPTE